MSVSGLATKGARLTVTETLSVQTPHTGVAMLQLNRPDRLNAINDIMVGELNKTLAALGADSSVNAVVMTGAGRGFCAGADLSLLSSVATEGLDSVRRAQAVEPASGGVREDARADFQKKYSYFPSMSKPVIAAVNGPCVGLGLVIALYCDLRFASDAARFSTAFARRGLIAEYGMAWMLPRLVGHPNAVDLMFSARMIDAAEAFRMGLVNQVIPQDVFREKVREYAADLASNVSPRSLRVMKRQIYEAMFQTLAEAFETSQREMLASLQCADFKEGVAHFVEKRTPVFTGK